MVVGGLNAESDAAKVAFLGLGHASAYFIGTLVLGGILRRRVGHPFFPMSLWKVLPFAALLALLAWWIEDLVHPTDRLTTLAVLAAIGIVAAAAYFAMLKLLPKRGRRFEAAFEPADPDLAAEE